jgi:SAM domain (Sterile alpha motif)
MDVAARLRGLGLEQYAPAFRDNDVDGEVLPELTADDLISIGVTSVGHPTVLPQLPAVHSVGGSAGGNRYHVRHRLEGPLPPRGTGVRLLRSRYRPGHHHPRLSDREAH